jgi:hypothetical protein
MSSAFLDKIVLIPGAVRNCAQAMAT